MKRLVFVLCLLLMLTACGSPYDSDGDQSTSQPDHSHTVPAGDNVVAHEPEGYCGNTVTNVRYVPVGKTGEEWERSFWGGTSVGLTDFLRWLDYDDGICRCIPEYYIRTEFGQSEYGLNLTQGYVRYEGKQCQLTEEQKEWLTTTIKEIAAGNGKDLCALPLAEDRTIGPL